MNLPKEILAERILQAIAADDNIGFCKECGAEKSNVEPDAVDYACEECGQHAVCGAEELLIEGWCE
jgi:Zn finger protein HypA/HybF involved in hydrogenase expression